MLEGVCPGVARGVYRATRGVFLVHTWSGWGGSTMGAVRTWGLGWWYTGSIPMFPNFISWGFKEGRDYIRRWAVHTGRAMRVLGKGVPG